MSASKLPASFAVSTERIESVVLGLRGMRVILDSDLAGLYGVPTRALNQAVKRNVSRFPVDFMFQLTEQEAASLPVSGYVKGALNRSHFVTGSIGKAGGSRKHRNVAYRPYAFTEQGVAMLSSVLRSPRAVQVNIEIMRTFVRLRQWLASNAELARKLEDLEKRYDHSFKAVFDAIRQLMKEARPRKRREIGFHAIPPNPPKEKSKPISI